MHVCKVTLNYIDPGLWRRVSKLGMTKWKVSSYLDELT